MSDHFENSLPLSNVIVDIHDLCKDEVIKEATGFESLLPVA